MEEQPQLLKEKILHSIEKRKVRFALFYTFNFEPVFFENYVLPLLMPDPEKFTDSVIANQILWREYRKNDEIPNITVYCDDFAKSTIQAPTLEYKMRCMRVPCASGAITNFHLKHIFLLLDDDTLLFINGSGNLTPAGWCRNVESFSIEVFNPKTRKLPFFNETALSKLVAAVAELFNEAMTEPERKIQLSLKQWNFTDFKYFNSFESDFKSFIKNNILTSNDTIQFIEIISPYFSPTDQFIKFIQNDVVHKSYERRKIRFLLPMRQDEINLDKETFNKLSTSSVVTWHDWLQKPLNERYTHAKIYRFVGKKTTFTIIGSVNFTEPAWSKYEKGGNKANIEAAILYESKTKNVLLLDEKPIDTTGMRFILKPDSEANPSEQNAFASRNAPNIIFTIDWQARTLSYNFPPASNRRVLDVYKYKWEGIVLNTPKGIIYLNKEPLRKLAKNSLIEITEYFYERVMTYFYYPNHVHFAQKPLTTRLSSDEMLYYWNHLDDKLTAAQSLVQKLSDSTDEETGEIEKVPSLLNEWALTFNGLAKLEAHLFFKSIDNQMITYYLTHKSYDTILTYLDELDDNYNNKKVYNTFYWMVLQIIKQNFYENSVTVMLRNTQIADTLLHIKQKIEEIESKLPDFKSNRDKYNFLKQQIKSKPFNGTV